MFDGARPKLGNIFYTYIVCEILTLKEDVDVADKALAADVRDNMEP